MADQKLSAEELKALSPEELQELVIQNQEAYDKLQSETTKWAQKVIDEKKLLEKAMTTVIKDKESLATIAEADPELANTISQKLFGTDYEPANPEQKQQQQEVDVEKIVERQLDTKEVNKRVSKVVEQLPEDIREKFTTEYEELIQNKEVTGENVEKYIKAALSLVSDDDDNATNYIKSVSLWGGTWGKRVSASEAVKNSRAEYAKDFLAGI